MNTDSQELGVFRRFVAAIGAGIIHSLILFFGRKISIEEHPWLKGPVGSDHIGETPYTQCAEAEGLTIERHASQGGLIGDFEQLKGQDFNPAVIAQPIVDFYENTARYRMDVWSKSYFPMNIGLWLLVTTISRKVNQLNFPTDSFDSAKGLSSEILLLRDQSGEVKYTGWLRTIGGRVLYTGFYMLETVSGGSSVCVKVVFPMPDGNATVILRPEAGENGELYLTSEGKGFGDSGFYRLRHFKSGLRVWRIKSLKERFRVYLDDQAVLRCDHDVRFWGLPVLSLHYRIELSH
jgi:hypothetical protein